MILIFSLLILQLSWAESAPIVIEQAQALALKKNRQEAARVLSKALETSSIKSHARLNETLSSLAKVFFTDKGQKLYESGQSAMFENPEAALLQFREALNLEDENVLLLDSIARVQLNKQDCEGAEATAQKARMLFPSLVEPALLELRALVCLRNFELFREKLKALPALDKEQDTFVQYLAAQDFLQQKMWRKATDVLIKVSEQQPRFPEVYYFLSKAGTELDLDSEAWALKYVSLCKGISVRERKKFSLEPRLCANAKEVQDELAKKAADI